MKLGVFPGSLDPIFFKRLPDDIELCYLIATGSAEEHWAQAFLPENQIIRYELSKEGKKFADFSTQSILQHSSLDTQWEKHDIEALLITHRGSEVITAYAERHNLIIVSTAYELQRKFEDKLWFDSFMKSHDISSPRSCEVDHGHYDGDLSGRLVVQEPASFGSSGTYFLNDATIQDFLDGKKREGSTRFLVREFLEGDVFGISLFLGNDLQLLSIPRRQCFWSDTDDVNDQRLFAGISWVPHEMFSESAYTAIESVFQKLGSHMYELEFRGFANFDFILTDAHEVSVIECNPRLSSATPHIFAYPGIIGSQDVAAAFLESTIRPRMHAEGVPLGISTSNYAGSLLDIPYTGKGQVQNVYANGRYQFSEQGVSFLGPDIRSIRMQDVDQCIVYSDAQVGDVYERHETILSVLSNVALFDDQGSLNESGQQLVEYFNYE